MSRTPVTRRSRDEHIVALRLPIPTARFDIVTTAALLSVMALVLLEAVRVVLAVSVVLPLQIQTSGAEYEALFSLWTFVQGGAVYHDRLAIPYNAGLFNWLFYVFYGSGVAAVQQTTGLDDPWLPTVARMITLTGAAVFCMAAGVAFRQLAGTDKTARRLGLCFAVLISFGPLTGYWTITARPDVWAIACDAVGCAAMVTLWPTRRRWAVAAALIAAYLGWSFKQTDVVLPITVVLFLVSQRAFGLAAVFTVVLWAAFASTFVVGGEAYRSALLFSDYPLAFSFEHGIGNAAKYLIKTVPVWASVGLGLAVVWRGGGLQKPREDPLLWFALIGCVGSTVYAFAIATQTGATENYYFSAALYTGLLASRLTPVLLRGKLMLPVAATWLLAGAVALGILGGAKGRIDLRADHQAVTAVMTCVGARAQPMFVAAPQLELPWILGGTSPFPLSYVYEIDRARGREFEAGGIGGLISRTYFATLVLPGTDGPPKTYDGASLDGYVPTGARCDSFYILDRRP